MVKITSQNQVSFVPRRSIQNNIVVAQETVHSLRGFRGNKVGIAIEIDLENAYDTSRWDFLEDTLSKVSFPELLISVIMNCMSSTSFQIL